MSVRTSAKRAGLVLLTTIIVLLVASTPTARGDGSGIHQYANLNSEKGRPIYVPGQLIVEFAPATEPMLQSQVLAGNGLNEIERLDGTSFMLVEFESGGAKAASADRDPLTVAQDLLQHPAIASAEPNYYRYAHFSPNDTYYSYQWHFPMIQTEQAWDHSTGSGVIVAVVDTGVAYETAGGFQQAPDLAGTTFVAGYDFVNGDTHPNDDESHGTHVTGTIAQTTNNSLGVAGIAFDAKIMPVKVLDSTGTGSAWDVAQGIKWATDHGANVINLSLGSSSGSSVEEDAVQFAYDSGVTVVASAGNSGTNSVGYPAAYDVVIAVGAVRYDETLAYYSDHGPALDVVAPGGDMTSDQNGDGYGDGVLQQTFNPSTQNTSDFSYYFFQGTSMASPHVAGAAALLIAQGIATTPDEVRAALESTAKDLGSPGRDDTYGYGLIQVADALAWNSGPTATPTATPTGPTPIFTATPIPTATSTPADDWETRVVQLINVERAAMGLSSLSVDSRLVAAARRHSQDMATNDFFDHYGSDGSSPFDRIRDAGYNFTAAGETIAAGYTSPEAAVNGWMNSSGHRAILLGNYAEVGVGYAYNSNSTYRRYWTADFAIPSGYNPTLTPSPTRTPTPTTPSPTATSSPTNTPTSTYTPTATDTPTHTPSPTDTPTNTSTPTDTPTDTPAPTHTASDTPEPTSTPTSTPSPTATATVMAGTNCGDLDGNSVVDAGDLGVAAGDWGSTGPSLADVNGDSVVDVRDLAIIAAQWGTYCTRN